MAERNSNGQTFDQWFKAADKLTVAKYQVGLDDLPDMDFREAFHAGQTPEEFVGGVVKEMIASEFGMSDSDLGLSDAD